MSDSHEKPMDGPADIQVTGDEAPRRRLRLRILAIALVLALVASTAAVTFAKRTHTTIAASDLVKVGGISMVPTLQPDDVVRIAKMPSGENPQRYWVVTFFWPGDEIERKATLMVKRVIGLPGETIEGRNGAVFINGERLDEPYLQSGTVTNNLARVTVPPETYFVLGDNRDHAPDSRLAGPIKRTSMVHHVVELITPKNRPNLILP